VSPPLHLDDHPPETISVALVMEDPDLPGPTWVHWVLFDLPPVAEISEGVTGAGVSGANSWRRVGYAGPCPPTGIHRYLFRVFALDDTLRLPERSRWAEIDLTMRGKVLADAVLMGRYGRQDVAHNSGVWLRSPPIAFRREPVASITRKVVKNCSQYLHPGETFECAVFGRPAGSFGRSVAFGVGGLAGAVASEKVARKREGRCRGRF